MLAPINKTGFHHNEDYLMNEEILLNKNYYNLGELPKLLHVSKKTFYKMKQSPHFPKVISLSKTFKIVSRTEMDHFVAAFNEQRQAMKEQKERLVHALLDTLPPVTLTMDKSDES